MAEPNYKFGKRQRELAQKQKQEEKRLKKLARNAAADAAKDAGGASPVNEEPTTQPEQTS